MACPATDLRQADCDLVEFAFKKGWVLMNGRPLTIFVVVHSVYGSCDLGTAALSELRPMAAWSSSVVRQGQRRSNPSTDSRVGAGGRANGERRPRERRSLR